MPGITVYIMKPGDTLLEYCEKILYNGGGDHADE